MAWTDLLRASAEMRGMLDLREDSDGEEELRFLLRPFTLDCATELPTSILI